MSQPVDGGSESSAVRIERRGGVGELVLARPERRNALDYAAVGEILDALRSLDDDADVGAVLMYGEGPSFCAGGDLAEFQRGLSTSAYDFHRTGELWSDLMLAIPGMRGFVSVSHPRGPWRRPPVLERPSLPSAGHPFASC